MTANLWLSVSQLPYHSLAPVIHNHSYFTRQSFTRDSRSAAAPPLVSFYAAPAWSQAT